MRYSIFILFTVSLLCLLPLGAQGQLLGIKQTVFGMDCAPCAYALENRISNLEGVTAASVSLNNGLLTATLAKDNTLTLRQIRQAVEKSGFSPKKADIKVKGIFKKENDRFFLIVPSGDKYTVQAKADELREQLKTLQPEEMIILAGQIIPESTEKEYWTLVVDTL